MTPEPPAAALDQLAAHHDRISRLDVREASHFTALTERLAEITALITAIGRTLDDETAALARLEALDHHVTELTARLTGPGADDDGSYQPGPAPAWWKLTAPERSEPLARLRAWVEQVYRPGYGHLAATLGPCWESHDLCLYGLEHRQPAVVGAVPPAPAQHRAAVRPGRVPGPSPARPGRPADDRDHPLRPPPAPPGACHDQHHLPPGPGLRRPRLAGVPLPARTKIPATAHGFRDASTDEQQITAWFTRHPGANLAIATGAPGPDILDVDQHGPGGNGFPAFARLRPAGLLAGASAYVRTPSGGMHVYFTGTSQRCGHLPGCHLDFRSAGGYILAPPSRIGAQRYQLFSTTGGDGSLDWDAVTWLLAPQRHQHQQGPPRPDPGHALDGLARWVAAQPEGNRNAGLFWAANRALETDPAADLSPLAAAARQAGLADPEITRTLESARRTRQPRPDHQAEAGEGR